MKSIRLILLLSLLSGFLGILSSCNKSVDTETITLNNTPANTMVVTIDSTSYSWRTAGTSVTNSGTTITVEGANTNNDGNGVGFTLTNITQPGSYDVLTNGTALTGVTIASENITSGQVISYSSTSVGTSAGKFTIQFISPDSLKATFKATLAKVNGSASAPTSMAVAGSVNVSFKRQ